jgi:AcrR family transcriptional regulator
MVRESSKDAILDAAEAIVREQGAAHLTLDAAAERAGLSKGGILYHFQTKDSLLVALVERMTQAFQGLYEEARARMGNDPERMLEAYLEAVFAAEERLGNTSCSLIPALAANPELLEPIRVFYKRHFAHLQYASVGWDQAAVVTLALDGMWLLEMLGVSPLEPQDKKRIAKLLARLATEKVQ